MRHGSFSKRFAHAGRHTYERIIQAQFGLSAPEVLARYPWRSFPSRYRTAYAFGAVWTDSGRVYGIGGCNEQRVAQELSGRDPPWFYEFDVRTAPAVNRTLSGYRLGADHTSELPFMWPSYNSSANLYARLTPAQHELSRWMLRYWGAFVRAGDPELAGQTPWPSYGRSGKLMLLRPRAASRAVPGGGSPPSTGARSGTPCPAASGPRRSVAGTVSARARGRAGGDRDQLTAATEKTGGSRLAALAQVAPASPEQKTSPVVVPKNSSSASPSPARQNAWRSTVM